MKLARVGIIVQGKKAYCYDVVSFLCSLDESRASIMSLSQANTAANWINFMIPNMETFVEPLEQVVGSAPKDCPACDQGHCEAHR